MELRDYQRTCVNKCLDHINSKSNKPGVVVAPTASGKSLIISSLAKELNEPVLVLQPSLELLKQNIGKLYDLGGNATIYSASANSKKISNFMYGTLGSVKQLGRIFKNRGINNLLIDESHHSFSHDPGSSFMNFIEDLQPENVIGLTATPYRLKSGIDGSQLNLLTRMRPGYFKHYIDIIQIQEIVAKGYWSKIIYEERFFDESGLLLNTNDSEFTDESIRKQIEVQGINKNALRDIKNLLAQGCPSILVFVDCVESAKKFVERVPNSEYLSSETKPKERERIVREFKAGKIKVLFNFGILTTGFDYPDLRAILMVRPTMSLALYYQIVGRGTRTSLDTGKEYCLFVDYCNNVKRFGRVENLTMEEIQGWGWGIFNGDILLTNTPIGGLKKTKQELIDTALGKKIVSSGRMWFGIHTGKKYEDLPKHYMEFMLHQSGFNFSSPKMKALKDSFEAILKKDSQLVFK